MGVAGEFLALGCRQVVLLLVVVDGQEVDRVGETDVQVDRPAAAALSFSALAVRPAELPKTTCARDCIAGIRVRREVSLEIDEFIIGHQLGTLLGEGTSLYKEHATILPKMGMEARG